jgi:nitrite reductase (NADH) large subunit
MKHLIIGNGVAGTTAAQNIRRFEEAADITVISEEAMPFYSRIRLPEFISGSLDEKKLLLHGDLWYEDNRINLITNKKAVSIEHAGKQVVLDGDARIPYDKLLVATGGKSIIPPIRGIDRKGIFTLRTIDDARRIKEFAEKIISVIILGGGVLGLDLGNALRKLGKSVTFIEYFDRLLPRQIDPAGSAVLVDKLKALGMTFVLGAKAEETLGIEAFEKIRLHDGSLISGQMLLISAGMAPDISLFKDLNIPLRRGVPVNDRMETELADIYAAGDAAEHGQKIYGIWPAAEKQGEVAGVNMAGGNAIYSGTTPSNSVSVAGIELFSAGEIDAECQLPSFAYEDRDSGIYRKIVVRDDTVAGCILCGDTTGKREVIAAIQGKRHVRDIQETIDKLKLTWSSVPNKVSPSKSGLKTPKPPV